MKKKEKRNDADEVGGLAALGDDVLENIVRRLPAVSFASVACVCRSLRRVCARVLSRPKLASALSFNPCPAKALQEVVDKVLSEPIRPHFAIVNSGLDFELDAVLSYIGKELGAQTPIIVSHARGIIGRDAITNEVKEEVWCFCRKWPEYETDVAEHGPCVGILLTVGFVPGLKVDVIPLLKLKLDEEHIWVNKFISDVGEYSTSVSGCPTPVAVIMFVGELDDVNCVVEKIGFALPMEAALVGLEGSIFVYRRGNDSRYFVAAVERSCTTAAVALIFAKDRDGTPGTGEIMFHVVLSNGVSAVGPRYMDACVLSDNFLTDLTTRREGEREILNGVSIVKAALAEVGNGVDIKSFDWCYMYVGVTKRRRVAIGAENAKEITYLSFYGFYGIGEVSDHLQVEWDGIDVGDCFQFYYADPEIVLASCSVHTSLRCLKLGCDSICESSHHLRGSHGNVDKREIFGGFLFSSSERAASFFGQPNVNISPFVESFPGVPVGGLFCHGEIGRCSSGMNVKGNPKGSFTRQCCHVFSTVYLVMSYAPFVRE